MPVRRAEFRFYAELADFLRGGPTTVPHLFELPASVKDMVEAIGVPHPEVDLVVVNGRPVDWSYLVQDGDRIAVYPRFRSLDVHATSLVHEPPPVVLRFVLDTHLGRLARYLRLLGCDSLHRNDFSDRQLAEIAESEQRVVLTRDIGLLKRSTVRYGYFVRSIEPVQQAREVVARFDVHIVPFTRCMACNGLLERAEEDDLQGRLPERIGLLHDEFWTCRGCRRTYWRGSHYPKLEAIVEAVRSPAR